MFAVMQSKALQSGIKQNLMKTDSVIDLVKQALPEYSQYLDQHGVIAANNLLGELENRLLAELRATVEGTAQDEANLGRAAKILKASQQVETELAPTATKVQTAP
ncbi:hypothetical protein WT24_27140 [Burkholderia sp. MSMB1078WGS]|nr:hypothetical protein WT24_27140 [Burkholderia sp. MSMB1078WGS]